ncbi:MAG: O-antigen ligase family protein [bacterium]|nr:O-antigen ligase family protein [bacterium]
MPTFLNTKRVVTYLIYAVTLTPAIVAGSFLFPYIAPRTVFFRVMIELALLVCVFLLIRYQPELKKQRNYFLYVFGAFVAINIISSIFSLAPIVSWFSDTERMWGVFTLLHIFALYLILRALFTGDNWKIYINIALVVSVYISFYGLAQYYPEVFNIAVFNPGKGRIITTLGNSAYVAIYMAFSSFFALFLLLRSHNLWLRLWYIFVMFLSTYAFILASIRGTALGVMAGLTVAALIYILYGQRKKNKIVVAVILALAIVGMFSAQFYPNSKIVKSNLLFSKLAGISISGDTVTTRMIGWRAAWEGFKEKPIFGVGMENYHTVFNKYFDSNYYLYAPTEPYFDRSHNAWLDVLVMNGILGLIIFLGFPFFIFYYLIKSFQQKKIKIDELLIFTALSITYFVHLIFVFDDLNSYIYFIVLIAFIEYRHYKSPMLRFSELPRPLLVGRQAVILVSVVLLSLIIYQFNVKTMQAGNTVIKALSNGGDLEATVELFDKSIAIDGLPSRNVVMSYVNYITNLNPQIANIKQNTAYLEIAKKGVLGALEALQTEIDKDPYNALLYNRLATLNNTALITFEDIKYAEDSIQASEKAIELSREHLQYYYTLAETFLMIGNSEQAVNAVNTAIEINARYLPSYYYLARVYFAVGKIDKAYNTARLFSSRGYQPPEQDFFVALADGLTNEKRYDQAIEVLRMPTAPNREILISLVKNYLYAKDNDRAIAAFEEIEKLDATLKPVVSDAISRIKAGKTAELLEQLSGGQKK